MKLFSKFLIGVGLLLTGCTGMPSGGICWFGECPRIPLNEATCLKGNWEVVGEQDGYEGYQYLADSHEQNCAKYKGSKLQRAAYQKGWSRGNRRYCTPQNGYRVGLAGESYENVCPAEMEAAFLQNFNAGIRIYNVRYKYNALLEEQERLVKDRGEEEQKLAVATDDWRRRRALSEIADIDVKLHRVSHKIRLYEMKHVDILAE